MDWLAENTRVTNLGVVYFADDDNTYNLQVFHEVSYAGSLHPVHSSMDELSRGVEPLLQGTSIEVSELGFSVQVIIQSQNLQRDLKCMGGGGPCYRTLR